MTSEMVGVKTNFENMKVFQKSTPQVHFSLFLAIFFNEMEVRFSKKQFHYMKMAKIRSDNSDNSAHNFLVDLFISLNKIFKWFVFINSLVVEEVLIISNNKILIIRFGVTKLDKIIFNEISLIKSMFKLKY